MSHGQLRTLCVAEVPSVRGTADSHTKPAPRQHKELEIVAAYGQLICLVPLSIVIRHERASFNEYVMWAVACSLIWGLQQGLTCPFRSYQEVPPQRQQGSPRIRGPGTNSRPATPRRTLRSCTSAWLRLVGKVRYNLVAIEPAF